MLVLTLLIMGVATFLIGLLPTYDQIGVLAPVLLVVLRIVQGIGVGVEWGGAVLMMVERAPPERRGFYGSWPQMGSSAALLIATGIFTLVSQLPEEQFLSWGLAHPLPAVHPPHRRGSLHPPADRRRPSSRRSRRRARRRARP
jgi:MFS family permease